MKHFSQLIKEQAFSALLLHWLAVLLILLSAFPAISQNVHSDSTAETKKADTLIKMDTFEVKKRFWRASWQLGLVELIPWSVNYFIRDKEFARVSMETISYNLQFQHWEWDDNQFTNNQFSHPYHGNLYFSSFRSNGYTFWQSAPAAFAGSFIWEVAGETHPRPLMTLSIPV